MSKKITREKLKRLKLELQELLGLLSVDELTKNWKLINRYQELHQAYIYA